MTSGAFHLICFIHCKKGKKKRKKASMHITAHYWYCVSKHFIRLHNAIEWQMFTV